MPRPAPHALIWCEDSQEYELQSGENLSGGSREETSKPSLAGWPSMPRFPSSGEQDGSRSGKKAGEVAEAIGMPIASRIDASARAILGHQPW